MRSPAADEEEGFAALPAVGFQSRVVRGAGEPQEAPVANTSQYAASLATPGVGVRRPSSLQRILDGIAAPLSPQRNAAYARQVDDDSDEGEGGATASPASSASQGSDAARAAAVLSPTGLRVDSALASRE